jgi:CheY-like chemotaxis protein
VAGLLPLLEDADRLILCSPAAEEVRESIRHRTELAGLTVVERVSQLPHFFRTRQQQLTAPGDAADSDLRGTRVLIVDDDIRNIFTLTSVLESWNAEVLHAERGADGIAILERNPDIDVALIDIMMPDMDGYQTMQEIKRRASIAEIPLISVTAKAMKGDRQKCLDAGASDYIAKPVDLDLLGALIRVWTDRARSARGHHATAGRTGDR